jgi:NAD(P)-dependent dehydrogenase (short-subunit alcohol dehydrogenase family)
VNPGTVLITGAATGIGALAAQSLDSMLEDTERLFTNGRSPDPQIVADEIVRIVELLGGQRPPRTVADGSDYGAEIINGAAEELRIRLARRMHITGLLGSEGRQVRAALRVACVPWRPVRAVHPHQPNRAAGGAAAREPAGQKRNLEKRPGE